MQPQFFGNPDHPLFGVYHRARGTRDSSVRAAVICPPIGQEYIRSHWCLRLLAGQLARKGVDVLRFDYTGIGDSPNSICDVETVEQWYVDIGQAVRQLKKLSGAESVMLIGLRLGATLAAEFARYSDDVNSLVLWEPVHVTSASLNELRKMHSQLLDLWICKMETDNNENFEEILGSLYSRPLIRELESLAIDWVSIRQPHLLFEIDRSNSTFEVEPNPLRKIEATDDEDSWTDLRQLETAWLRPQTNRKMVAGVTDIFERLIRFGVLTEGVAQ